MSPTTGPASEVGHVVGSKAAADEPGGQLLQVGIATAERAAEPPGTGMPAWVDGPQGPPGIGPPSRSHHARGCARPGRRGSATRSVPASHAAARSSSSRRSQNTSSARRPRRGGQSPSSRRSIRRIGDQARSTSASASSRSGAGKHPGECRVDQDLLDLASAPWSSRPRAPRGVDGAAGAVVGGRTVVKGHADLNAGGRET